MSHHLALRDKVFTSLRGLLLIVAFPLLVLWLGWLIVDTGMAYLHLWQIQPKLLILAIPFLPLALIAVCSAAYVVMQVSFEAWNRLSRHLGR